MKRLLLSLVAFGGLGFFAAPATAGPCQYPVRYGHRVVVTCPAPCVAPCAPAVTVCEPRWHYNRYYGGHVGGYHVRRAWRCR